MTRHKKIYLDKEGNPVIFKDSKYKAIINVSKVKIFEPWNCPNCKKQLAVVIDKKFKNITEIYCPSCNQFLKQLIKIK